MKKGQIVTGIVEYVDFPNKALVHTDEGEVVVKNAIPGQKVTVRVQKMRKSKAEGMILSVDEKSPLECKDVCPHFGACGGCLYISLPYEEQIAIKEAQVKKLLAPALSLQDTEAVFEGVKKSPEEYEYRNKMEFSFGDEYMDGPLSLGMHKRGSFYDIVSVSQCQIIDEDYRRILTMTRDFFADRKEEGITFFHRLRHTGYLRHLLVRKAKKTGEILIALVTTTQLNVDLTSYKDALLDLELTGEIAGILHIENDSIADVVKSDCTKILYGKDYFTEELLGLSFKISTFSFFQTNSRGAEVLYNTVREYVGKLDEDGEPDKVVFDLYSGTGTIAQMLAPAAKKVVGVEIVEEAVVAARENAQQNGLDNCTFIAADVLKALDEIDEKPDFIILDPPRDGVHPKALEKICKYYNVEQMVYISCKPSSLARDLEILHAQGYEVVKYTCVDMFPWTGNIETVVLLSKKI